MNRQLRGTLFGLVLTIPLIVLIFFALNPDLLLPSSESDSKTVEHDEARMQIRALSKDVHRRAIQSIDARELEEFLYYCRNLRGKKPNLTKQSSFHTLVDMGERALLIAEAALVSGDTSTHDKAQVCYFVALRCGRAGTMAARLRAPLTMLVPAPPLSAPQSLIDALTLVVQSNDGLLRQSAATAIGGVGDQAQSAVPTLTRLISPSSENMGSIALALQELGPIAAPAAPKLVKLLDIEDSGDLLDAIGSPAYAAYGALEAMGEAAVPHVVAHFRATRSNEAKVRIAILLSKVAPAGHEALMSLFLSARDPQDRLLLLSGLGYAGDRALPIVDRILSSNRLDRDGRRDIAAMLVNLEGPNAASLFKKHNLIEVTED